MNSPIRALQNYPVSDLDFLDYQQQCNAFSGMATYERQQMDLIGKDTFERLAGLRVSKAFFEVLRLRPASS